MQLLGSDLWATLRSEIRRPGTKRIAVAYVTDTGVLRLQPGDCLIADVSEAAVRTGQTSAAALLRLRKQRVAIYSDASLHAKVFILANCVVVGSNNVSMMSSALHEAAIITRGGALRAQAIAWFDRTRAGAKRLATHDLERLAAIPVERKWTRGKARATYPSKPTLLDALASDDRVLRDYVFSWVIHEQDLSERKVTQIGRSKRILPEDATSDEWSWSEFKDKRGLANAIRAAYKGKPGICFYGRTDSTGHLIRFTDVDGFSTVYLGSTGTSVRGTPVRLVFERAQDSTPGLELGSCGWKRKLLGRLNHGLSNCPEIRRRLSARATGEVRLKELKALFTTGAT